jgi:Ca-activated chloride channel family protein
MSTCCRRAGAQTYRIKAEHGEKIRSSDVTAEGVFAEYFFETGDEHERVFGSTVRFGVSAHPTTGAVEHWLGIGLTSKYDGDGVRVHGRPPASVVCCIDISGSMNSAMGTDEPSKLEVAQSSLVDLVGRLRPDDEFGVVSFNTNGAVVVPLTRVSSMDRDGVVAAIQQLRAGGGTDLSAGFWAAAALLESRVG